MDLELETSLKDLEKSCNKKDDVIKATESSMNANQQINNKAIWSLPLSYSNLFGHDIENPQNRIFHKEETIRRRKTKAGDNDTNSIKLD